MYRPTKRARIERKVFLIQRMVNVFHRQARKLGYKNYCRLKTELQQMIASKGLEDEIMIPIVDMQVFHVAKKRLKQQQPAKRSGKKTTKYYGDGDDDEIDELMENERKRKLLDKAIKQSSYIKTFKTLFEMNEHFY